MKMTITIYVCPCTGCEKRFASRKKLNQHYQDAREEHKRLWDMVH